MLFPLALVYHVHLFLQSYIFLLTLMHLYIILESSRLGAVNRMKAITTMNPFQKLPETVLARWKAEDWDDDSMTASQYT